MSFFVTAGDRCDYWVHTQSALLKKKLFSHSLRQNAQGPQRKIQYLSKYKDERSSHGLLTLQTRRTPERKLFSFSAFIMGRILSVGMDFATVTNTPNP